MTDRNLEYAYDSAEHNASHDYLLPAVLEEVRALKPLRVFDLGCGNGSVANAISAMATVEGIDVSESAVRNANAAYPNLRIELGSAYEDLAARFGHYGAVVSLEVVEHLYDPRAYAKNLFDLLDPGGTAIISTPFHGYFKNLAMAVTGTLDNHFTALWDGGHIKFWSVRTLSALLAEAGFEKPRYRMVGRVPALAKSMIAIVRRPPAIG